MATNWGIETDTKASTTDVWSIDGAGSQETNWEDHLYSWDFIQSTWESLGERQQAGTVAEGAAGWKITESASLFGGGFWQGTYLIKGWTISNKAVTKDTD